jgi:hypothetical protein
LLPVVAACQGQDKDKHKHEDLVSATGTTLQVKVDAMSDRKTCTLSVRGDGIRLEMSSPSAVVIWIGYMSAPGRPRLLRVGDSAPFALPRQDVYFSFVLSKNRSRQVTEGLFAGNHIRVQFTDALARRQQDLELQPGDFRASYNRATENCAWPPLPVIAAPTAKEPKDPPR